MSTSYLSHFALSSAPFTKELDDAKLWLPPAKSEMVDELVDAVEARHSVLVVGEPGTGKSCVLRALRHRFAASSRLQLHYCHNVTLGRRDFYRQLCMALGLRAKATAAALFHAVSSHIQELSHEHIHPVLLLDEAQLLHQDTLDHLHILLNYEWDSRALLSLVLVGLPELLDRLSLRRNRSLYSRLFCRVYVSPLTPADTAHYIEARLEKAGANAPLLTREAAAMIHEATGGSMREIDRLMCKALRIAASAGHKLIEREVILGLLQGQRA